METYVISVVMYFACIWLLTWIYGDRIMENGWDDGLEEFSEDTGALDVILYTLAVSCLPGLRFLYLVLILVMATFTQEACKNWADEFVNRF